MFQENKNLKTNIKDTITVPAPYQTEVFNSGSYNKANKLIIALYMVTDILDKEEPLRNKLRTLGNDILSDIYFSSKSLGIKIDEILSFLSVGLSIGMISEMNHSILKKEFLELKSSLEKTQENPAWLKEFFQREEKKEILPVYNGHGIRIGVQKGSTLMHVLKHKVKKNNFSNNIDHSLLKQQRREEVFKIIKDKQEATITDIRNSATGILVTCGEKTLQRELVSMLKEGVLEKTGEKRWSRYFLPK